MVQASLVKGSCFLVIFESTQECQHPDYQHYSHLRINMQHLSASELFDGSCSPYVSNNHWIDISIEIPELGGWLENIIRDRKGA
jgi:hypothetical protein